jgi:hypothetical protein
MNIHQEVTEKHGPGPGYPNKRNFIKYYGYRKGENLGLFDSVSEAEKAGALTTEKHTDDEGFQAKKKEFQDHQNKILSEWMERLREHHSEVSSAVFDACYAKAYEEGHSNGYYEVELKLHHEVEFAEKIIRISKEESKNA